MKERKGIQSACWIQEETNQVLDEGKGKYNQCLLNTREKKPGILRRKKKITQSSLGVIEGRMRNKRLQGQKEWENI